MENYDDSLCQSVKTALRDAYFKDRGLNTKLFEQKIKSGEEVRECVAKLAKEGYAEALCMVGMKQEPYKQHIEDIKIKYEIWPLYTSLMKRYKDSVNKDNRQVADREKERQNWFAAKNYKIEELEKKILPYATWDIWETLNKYVDGKKKESTTENQSEVNELFEWFKNKFNDYKKEERWKLPEKPQTTSRIDSKVKNINSESMDYNGLTVLDSIRKGELGEDEIKKFVDLTKANKEVTLATFYAYLLDDSSTNDLRDLLLSADCSSYLTTLKNDAIDNRDYAIKIIELLGLKTSSEEEMYAFAWYLVSSNVDLEIIPIKNYFANNPGIQNFQQYLRTISVLEMMKNNSDEIQNNNTYERTINLLCKIEGDDLLHDSDFWRRLANSNFLKYTMDTVLAAMTSEESSKAIVKIIQVADIYNDRILLDKLIAYLAISAVLGYEKSNFDISDLFIRLVFDYPNVTSLLFNETLKLGRASNRRLSERERYLNDIKKEEKKTLIDTLYQPLEKLEETTTNILSQNKNNNWIHHIMKCVVDLRNALSDVGINTIGDPMEWLEQKPLNFNRDEHEPPTEFDTEQFVLRTLGIQSDDKQNSHKAHIYPYTQPAEQLREE